MAKYTGPQETGADVCAVGLYKVDVGEYCPAGEYELEDAGLNEDCTGLYGAEVEAYERGAEYMLLLPATGALAGGSRFFGGLPTFLFTFRSPSSPSSTAGRFFLLVAVAAVILGALGLGGAFGGASALGTEELLKPLPTYLYF